MAADDHGRSEATRSDATYSRDWQTDPERVAAAKAWMAKRTEELGRVKDKLDEIEAIIAPWEMANQARQIVGLYYWLVVQKIRDAHDGMDTWLTYHEELLNDSDYTWARNLAMFKVGWPPAEDEDVSVG